MLRQVKACALYIRSLSSSKEALIFYVMLLQSTADYLVSLLIASTVEEIKEKLIYMRTPRFVLSKLQHAALIQ